MTAWMPSSSPKPGPADLGQFLPPAGDPLHAQVLCELIRVDLDHAWEHGRPPSSTIGTIPRSLPGPGTADRSPSRNTGCAARPARRPPAGGLRPFGSSTAWPAPRHWPAHHARRAAETSAGRPAGPGGRPLLPGLPAASPADQPIDLEPWLAALRRSGAEVASGLPRPARDRPASWPAAWRRADVPARARRAFLGFRAARRSWAAARSAASSWPARATLADRPVALKVAPRPRRRVADAGPAPAHATSCRSTRSTAGPLQAVCMPYFGAHHPGRRSSLAAGRRCRRRPATSRQLPGGPSRGRGADPAARDGGCAERLLGPPRLSYVEAVLWLGGRGWPTGWPTPTTAASCTAT